MIVANSASIGLAIAVLLFAFFGGMVVEIRTGRRRRAVDFEAERAELYAAAFQDIHDRMRDERDHVLAAEDDNLATWLAEHRDGQESRDA
jgi:hypothetical protein